EDLVLGQPLFFATAMPLGATATGLLVESHEGRPTKIEGNPTHPASLGSADVFAQAAILSLYDPDRAQSITHLGEIQSWSDYLAAVHAVMTAQQPLGGAGLRLLTPSVSSPTLAAQLRDLLTRYPSAKWHQWDPLSHENAKQGALLAFGRYVDAQYRVDRADVIVSLDADFLCDGAAGLRYAREFASRRRPDNPARMNRLYVVDAMPTPTGASADHRLPLRPGEIEGFARRLAAAVGAAPSLSTPALDARAAKWVDVLARDLRAHGGACLVIAGESQPPAVHALAHAMNAALGSVGRTVVYTEPVEAEPVDQLASLKDLIADMRAGRVDVLMILGGNPVYSTPADLGFADALGKVMLRTHLSLHSDETSALCHWHVPEAHFLEAWSDARTFDGTASIIQPLIAPLYGGKTAHEMLAAMGDQPEQSPYDIVRAYWQRRSRAADFDNAWRRWLNDGVIPETALAPIDVGAPRRLEPPQPTAVAAAGSLEIAFRLDPSVADGRFANNAWLQELPKPVTKLTWENAVLVSPATAAALGATNSPDATGGEHGQIDSDVVELRYRGRSVRGLLFAVEGHPDGCATVHLGYGRERGGSIAAGVGFNANLLRTADAMWQGEGLQIVRTGQRASLACTQYHHRMEGREPVRAVTRDEFARNPNVIRDTSNTPPRTITLYPDYQYSGYRWGMSIDINACIGCNACIVACQAENNIPVVGKDEVLKGREMHWLRVDLYNRGAAENPETYFQPLPCMQCENAPCEVVCPVGATVHSDEGLNDMVYNRCVGTRYCQNNCPYKVRRFNYLLYSDWTTPSLELARNPNVTVRSRGVMEKCTYCVQRINRARIQSEKEDRRVTDGDIQTACAQTCPAQAIVFGDLNDPESRVSTLQAEARNYALLGELNTRPRTTYLAAVRNENPELAG
ncbi:MAG TPA: 4Fe-4S dicluster domain-containing protein, partial [Vicinamibacterales bacterium]|nr:4Fe-4S dicluster domain-containing protein [Vicinamibacterales bacterium]